MNIIHDGIHEIADTVLVKARTNREAQLLWVSPQGSVTIASARKSWRRTGPPPDAHLVGTYTRGSSSKAIREDLEVRRREIGL